MLIVHNLHALHNKVKNNTTKKCLKLNPRGQKGWSFTGDGQLQILNRENIGLYPRGLTSTWDTYVVYHLVGKNRLVESCSKWEGSKTPNGIACSIPISHRDWQHRRGLELEAKSKWKAHFPFGNSFWEFGTTFKEIPFSPEIFLVGKLIPTDISGFFY